MSWLRVPILILICTFFVPSSVWAQGVVVNRTPSLVFASPDSILEGNLEVKRQILFPERKDGFSDVCRSVSGVSNPVLNVPSVGSIALFGFVDPWGEQHGYLGNTNVADPGTLEAEWDAPEQEGYSWGGAIGQALLFTTVGHVFRIASEEKTRRELDGPFFKDWFKAAGSLFSSGWSDGGRDFTNYVVHPLSGSVYGHIYRQNHPRDRDIRISFSKEYLGHLGKTTAFSFIASLAWEIGPYSEASIGNVGIHNTPGSQQMTWGDVVVTPLVGVWGVMVIEDLFERFVIRKVEAKTANRWIKALFRIPLTPTRSAANLMAIKRPDYRPDRQ